MNAVPTWAGPIPRANPLAWTRLASVDVLRGLVMVIMTLDHVRVFFYFPGPFSLDTTTPAFFLTRWVPNLCSTTFMLLAGAGAYLSWAGGRTKGQVAWFLFTRGLWLAFLELTVVSASWRFNFDFDWYTPGVLWAIGWSMVVLAGLVFLPTWLTTLLGVAMIATHNLLDGMTAAEVGLPELLWAALHRLGKVTVVDGISFETNWLLVPWMGVMAVGYGFGAVLNLERAARRKYCCSIGMALVLGFVVLRGVNQYGDPRPWVEQSSGLRTAFAFVNTTKTPPSLLFLLMTLGPALLLLALFDRPLGPGARPLLVFGRVPLFFFVVHLPLIHLAAVALDYARFGWSPQATAGPWVVQADLAAHQVQRVPEDYGSSLPVIYATWIAILVLLYFPCSWFARLKDRHRSGWLSYF